MKNDKRKAEGERVKAKEIDGKGNSEGGMKKQNISKKLLFSVILLGLVILLISSYQPILIGAGRFLAPEGTGKADVVILEGEELIREKAVKVGIELLSSGNVKCMVVVLQQNEEDEKIFALDDYYLFLARTLCSFGVVLLGLFFWGRTKLTD